ILVNPGLAPRRATVSTMYTAYRLNDPDEIMPPHKHTPSAVRFGLTGKGNFTGVAGEDIVFGPGDMVLTPNDTWHNHGTVDGDPYEALMVEYVDPKSGGPVFKTITFFAQMLRPGEKTLPLRQTASLLVAPFRGKGHSIVDGERFDWNQFDTLAVPGGSWCQH